MPNEFIRAVFEAEREYGRTELYGLPNDHPRIKYLVDLSGLKRKAGVEEKKGIIHDQNYISYIKKFHRMQTIDELKDSLSVSNTTVRRILKNLGVRAKPSVNAKPIQQIKLNGVVVATYSSASEASRETGIEAPNIRRCSSGYNKTAGGYKWKYIEEGDN